MKNLVELVREKAPERYPETKQEIIRYFQMEAAASGGSWRQQLQGRLADFTGVKPKTLAKRFDPQRRANPEQRNAGQYRDFGKTLQPRADWPRGGFDIKAKVKVKISQKWEKKPRQFTIHAGPDGLSFDGQSTGAAHAEQFLREPTMDDLLDAYFPNGNIVEEYQTLDLQ